MGTDPRARERFALVGLRAAYAATSASATTATPLDEGGPFWTPIGGLFDGD